MIFQRTELLIGTLGIKKLKESHIAIFGLGGVGGYIVEGLVRCGIGEITLIDYDKIDPTNINRQILATLDTVGEYKVDVAEKRSISINKDIIIHKYREKLLTDNIDLFFKDKKYDYVADAIDMVTSKLSLIKYCYENNIPIISSMGTGNKLDPSKLSITDIYKTSVCPLAKVIRKKCKDMNIKKLKVLCSTEIPKKPLIDTDQDGHQKVIGSVSFVPSVGGLMIAGEIINNLLKNN